MRLLLVEDDRMFAELVRRGMKEEGHTVDVVSQGAQARVLALVNDFDGVILDVGLPDGSGLDVVRALRQQGRSTPILILSGHRRTADQVLGLDLGADDYVTKPFEMDVLKARVRALLRRGGAQRNERLSLDGLVLDRERREVLIRGHKLPLTPKECSLLEYLLLHPERVVTRTELLEKVWDLHFDPGSNVVDAHIARLRGKLRRAGARPQLITVRGTGFMLTVNPESLA